MTMASTTVHAMYWGRSVTTTTTTSLGPPSLFFWLLLWDSFAESTMRVGTPSHAELVGRLDALVDEPSSKRVYHVHFSEHPLPCIEAPVTAIAFAALKDIQCQDTWRRARESARSSLRAACPDKLKSVHGTTLEDVQTMVDMSGWESVEGLTNLGTDESHQKAIEDIEACLLYLKDLEIYHVHFERHTN